MSNFSIFFYFEKIFFSFCAVTQICNKRYIFKMYTYIHTYVYIFMEACVVFTLCLVVEKDISYIKLHYMYTYIFHNQYRYQCTCVNKERQLTSVAGSPGLVCIITICTIHATNKHIKFI